MKIIRKITLTILSTAVMSTVWAQLPYQNPNLSAEERAADLCSRLTIEEKAKLMMNGSEAIPRLGIPAFEWWSEALHGIGRNGVSTVFPQCIGMACSFDNALLEQIYSAVSDEGRAKNTVARRENKIERYKGLSFWTPNVNIFRDPRWGRGQETYGEDPFLNSTMGLSVVRGLQGGEGHKYLKLHACAKHFAVHSGPEKTRHSMDIEQLPARDLWETYLPAFKALVQQGNVQQVMCAYQRFEGDPCCGSNRLLQQILRDEWGFKGLVVSDCGAISDFWQKGRHGVSADREAATAKAILSGTDVECGSNYRSLPEAVRRGDISEAQVDVSVRRLLKGRFELGDFDPDELVEWTKIPTSVIASDKHKKMALQMAREQMVLLKNDGILPLSPNTSKIMVMGPNAADSTMLWGIYYGLPTHTVTILEGIEKKIGQVPYSKGCEVTSLTEQHSIFDLITDSVGNKGMVAEYWNNTDMEGPAVATTQYTAPISLDGGGNTTFHPGVALTNFTAKLKGSFVAEKTEDLFIHFINDDGMRVFVNGQKVYDRWRSDYPNNHEVKLPVEQGKRYDIELNYLHYDNVATLGFDIIRNQEITAADATKRAKDADVVIFVGGISPLYEREETSVSAPGFERGDRTSIELPQPQREILKALHDAGKKVVFVNCSGSAVALQQEQDETCDAILQAWYAGEQGGHAVADVLFGDYNPSGKLSVTFYKNDAQLPAFDDYHMTNRTYRYFRGEPLYPFGYGLSYTTFAVGKPQYKNGKVRVKVQNTGKCDGTEILQVYVRNPRDVEGPIKTLRGYQRVDLRSGESKVVEIDMPRERFELWDTATNTMRVVPGKHELWVGSSSAEKDLKKITVNVK